MQLTDIKSYVEFLINKKKKPAVAIEARMGDFVVSDHS